MLVREWPRGRPRILISDAWLANAGDGAIALATQERLARLAPGAAILHAAYQGDLVGEHYPELALVPPLAGLLGVTPAIPEMRGWDAADGRRIVAGADAVLSQGGGFAMEHYDPTERLQAWDLVVERGVPIGFGPQSVGRFRGEPARTILRRVYRAAVVVTLREAESVTHALENGAPPERLLVSADEAFGLDAAGSPARMDGAAARGGIACVLSRDPQLRGDATLVEQERSVATLARLVVRLVEAAGGEHVTLLSTCQGLGHFERGVEDDGAVFEEILAALPVAAAAQVRTVPGYLAPRSCTELIARHRMLVSTRMHPAIFAVCRGVPTALLTQAYKARSTFSMLRLDGVVVDDPDPVAGFDGWLARGPAERTALDLSVAHERVAINDDAVRRLLAAAA
jgi:polysaccharide pyruvyl transferase WcaK-like protein